jgi:hypothetical protein
VNEVVDRDISKDYTNNYWQEEGPLEAGRVHNDQVKVRKKNNYNLNLDVSLTEHHHVVGMGLKVVQNM